MALSNLQKKAENIEGEIMDLFIQDPSGSPWYSFGTIQDPSVDFEGQTKDSDNKGREKLLVVNVSLSFVMQQTGANERDAVVDVVQPEGKGHIIKATSEPTNVADVDSADGYLFKYVFPSVSGEFDGSGEGSMYEVSCGGIVPPKEIRDPSTIAFDA